MTEVQNLRHWFDRLIADFEPAHKSAAQERLNQLIEESRTDAIELLSRVLKAEVDLSFFEDGHKQRTMEQKGLFNFDLSRLTSRILEAAFPNYEFPKTSGLLGDYQDALVGEATSALKRDGYHVFPLRLPVDAIQSIESAIEQVPFRVRTTGEELKNVNAESVHRASGNTVWVIDQQDILAIPEVQSLVRDPMLLQTIQNYLECNPIHVQTNCWWTINRNVSEAAAKRDAHKFHQDKAFIRFVKVFVYLNDVTQQNGPHTYIAGSAKDYEDHVPDGYRMSHRIDDEVLQKEYSADRFKTLMGPAGTIVLEDTSGFHKGTPVIEGHRLMLQLQYCCSLYFNPSPCFTMSGLDDSFVSFAAKFPRTFMMYDDERRSRQLASPKPHLANVGSASHTGRKPGIFSRLKKALAG